MQVAEFARNMFSLGHVQGTGTLSVIVSSTWTIHQAFYRINSMYMNVIFGCRLARVGRTSYTMVNTCWSEQTGDLLFQRDLQFVTVNDVTMKPIAVPENVWRFVMRYEDVVESKPVRRVPVLQMPADTCKISLRVPSSDMDINMHLNNCNLVRLCHEAMIEAGQTTPFRSLDGDILSYWASNVECIYQGEAHAGDTLDIYVWEDKVTALLLHAVALKKLQPVAQCSIEFTTPIKHNM